jgi:hypothetical protein
LLKNQSSSCSCAITRVPFLLSIRGQNNKERLDWDFCDGQQQHCFLDQKKLIRNLKFKSCRRLTFPYLQMPYYDVVNSDPTIEEMRQVEIQENIKCSFIDTYRTPAQNNNINDKKLSPNFIQFVLSKIFKGS